jgi:hypothetical protein
MHGRLTRKARVLFAPDPINRSDPLNEGLLAWWLTVPHLYGGPAWYDLTDQYPLSFASMSNASNGWRPVTHPGGHGSVLFDGSAGYCLTSTPIPLWNVPPIAASAWINLRFMTYATIIGSNGPGGLQFRVNGDGSLDSLSQDVADIGPSATGVVPADTWTRVTLTYDSSGTYSYFANGQPVGSGTVLRSLAANAVTIGVNFDGVSFELFPGLIDDVRILHGNPIATASPASFAALDYEESLRGYPKALNFL